MDFAKLSHAWFLPLFSFKHQRQVQHTQEDSHELLRYLLYELKKEEIDVS